MSPRARRRRAFLMLSLALACGGLAASEVAGRVQEVERRVGSPVAVLVASHEVASGARIERADLALRQVPERFVAPDALYDPGRAIGRRTAIALAAGTTITRSQLAGGRQGATRTMGGSGPLRRGERAVEVAVTGRAGLAGVAGPSTQVDVLVSTEPHEGAGRSFLALEDVELLALSPADRGRAPAAAGSGERTGAADGLATLRVTLRQAVYLTAAQNFAREVRLLARPPGDGRRSGRTVVGAGSL